MFIAKDQRTPSYSKLDIQTEILSKKRPAYATNTHPLAVFIGALFGATAMAPNPAAAHVRWFVDQENVDLSRFEPYSIWEPTVLIWIAIATCMVGIAIFIDGKLPIITVANTKVRHDVMEMMRILTGMSFLLTAYDGALVAPHLQAIGGFGLFLVFLQAGIGLLLLSNHFLHYAALLMLVLFTGMMVQFGALKALEYVNVVGIALFLLFNYYPDEETRLRLKPYSVDILRIFTGIALVILGASEKLYGAALGQAFITDYPWNFMSDIGFEWFDDRLFVLSAGAMEVVFGVILVLGVVTRLTMAVVAGLMLISNITFILLDKQDEALIELIGHLPIIATTLILVLLGYGQRLKVTKWQPAEAKTE